MTTFETPVVKSIHIKECWPYEYIPPMRRLHTREAMDRQNELRRARYAKAVAVKTPKKQGSQPQGVKKLLGLKVYELDIDFCQSLNAEGLNKHGTR